MDLKTKIREIPNFPKRGVSFKDITPLLKDPKALRFSISRLRGAIKKQKIDKVVCIDARGFILGAILAYKLGAGLAIVRKKGKLPFKTLSKRYALEYGFDVLEIHKDAVKKNERVLVVDDVLATGGTAGATCDLVKKAGGRIVKVLFLIELDYLGGRKKLKDYDVFSLLHYSI